MSDTTSVKPGVQHILDNTKYPDYIRRHAIFQKLSKINKVFPGIGLPNCSDECQYTSIIENRALAAALVLDIKSQIDNASNAGSIYNGCSEIARRARAILAAMSNQLYYAHNFIVEEESKLSLKCPCDIYNESNGKFFAKKGESLFKVYQKICEVCKEAEYTRMFALEQLPSFKQFSVANIPGDKKYQIIFSSIGEQGAWDIATISMRGIQSCQSWGTPQSHGLIGSIASKYVGVIYITNGEDIGGYGPRTFRRALVRFCIHNLTKKPALLLDRVYPGDDKTSQVILKEFLIKRTKLPVLFPGDPDWGKYSLPYDPQLVGVTFQTTEYTYMDTKIPTNIKSKSIIDRNTFYSRIAQLDNELKNKISSTLSKMSDEYCVSNKTTHRDRLKGGVVQLIGSMKKHLGITHLSYFVPSLYNSIMDSKVLPNADTYETANEYERVIIKTLLSEKKNYLKDAMARSSKQMGKWIKFYPKSLPKLLDLVYEEYNKELKAQYKNLLKIS